MPVHANLLVSEGPIVAFVPGPSIRSFIRQFVRSVGAEHIVKQGGAVVKTGERGRHRDVADTVHVKGKNKVQKSAGARVGGISYPLLKAYNVKNIKLLLKWGTG